jgi:hypothetical protein|tara:strand:+ start:283 stop:591 length:309 start_codon:yes stop_codon:yes gene_type:complete
LKFFATTQYVDQPDRSVLTSVAAKIVRHGMTTPAILYLEMAKPLAFLGSQAMVFFGPIVTAFMNNEGYYQLAELLEERDNVEFLMEEIERLEEENKVAEVAT